MRVILESTEDVAAGIRTYWFRPEQKPGYQAGQFTELFLPHRPHDGRGQKRWFSLSSSPAEELLAVTTKFAPKKGSSFKACLDGLQPGAELHLAYPMGDFVLPKDTKRPLLFVGGGIGVTPFRSMIRTLQLENKRRDITLLYAANHPKELAFLDVFRIGYVRFVPIVREKNTSWNGLTGTLDAAKIMEYCRDDALIYLSGPAPMVKALRAGLRALGVPARRIVSDYFPGYSSV